MIVAHVTTDGSCVVPPARQGARRGSGGWAAIVENGSDGWVLRGSEPRTTSVRMELRAVIEGLRSLPDLVPVVVHSDASMVYVVWERWRNRFNFAARTNGDGALWVELALQFQRFASVEVRYVGRRDNDVPYQRAHVIAKGMARALANARPTPPMPVLDIPSRPREIAVPSPGEAARMRVERRLVRGRHRKGCNAVACEPGCPHGLQFDHDGTLIAWRVA